MRFYVVFLAFVFVTANCTEAAGNGATYLGDFGTPIELPDQNRCVMGNLNAPAFMLDTSLIDPNFLTLTFNPNDFFCSCTEGFRVLSVHLVVAYTDSVEFTMNYQARLAHGFPLSEPPLECHQPISQSSQHSLWPWAEVYNDVTVTLERPGYYEIDIDADGECAYLDYAYGISLFSGWSENHTVATDDNSNHCPDFLFASMGEIYWWVPFNAPGNMIVWANIECCENPVGTESLSWGSLKALYR